MNFISKVSQHLSSWLCAEATPEGSRIALELDLQSLEDRVLYSAAPVPAEFFVEAADVDAHLENVDQQIEFLTDAVEQLQYEATSETDARFDFDEFASNQSSTIGEESRTIELIVIDSAVENHAALQEDVLRSYSSDRVQVYLIDSNTDGVKEIGRLVDAATTRGASISAIHIVSHGDAGQIQLGNVTLSQGTLTQHSSEIASWQDGLANDASILIYGCNLAEDGNGESLVDSISSLTDASVAASDDVTGHEDLGGDWDLEYTAGVVNTDVIFSASTLESWNHSLQATIADESGTSHKSIAADFDGNLTIVSSNNESGNWNVEVSRYLHFELNTPLTNFEGNPFESIQVNNDTTPADGDHRHAVVGSASNGDFVVAWVWSNPAETVTKVFAKVYDSLGNVVKDQFEVVPGSVNARNVSVAMSELGDIVIGWEQHNGADNDVFVQRFTRAGEPQESPNQIDTVGVGSGGLAVSINDAGQVAVAYNGPDPDAAYARFVQGSFLSSEFMYTTADFGGLSDFSVDLNDNQFIAIGFEADGGPAGSEVRDIYSMLLRFDFGNNTLLNVSPTTTIPGGSTVQATLHAGGDAELEYAPSIAIENSVFPGSLEQVMYHVAWNGNGSWQTNLLNGSVVDSNGNVVADASEFPSGSVVADDGVFVASTTFTSDGVFTSTSEQSLQNNIEDFNTNSQYVSITAYQDRSKIASVFESADAQFVTASEFNNQPPQALDSISGGLENFGIRFRQDNFRFADAENDDLHSVRIETLPATGELTFLGNSITQSDVDAAGGVMIPVGSIEQLRYVPLPEAKGPDVATFEFSVSAGREFSTVSATMTLSLTVEDRLWVSTVGDTSADTGIPGDGSGTLQFGGATVTYGQDTLGYWSQQFAPAGLDIDSIYYVDAAISVGTTSPIQLNRGDILFSAKNLLPALEPVDPLVPVGPGVVTVLPTGSGTVTVKGGDIIRFRPTSPDYSTGTYEVVASVELLYPTTGPDYELHAFAIVEQDTVVAGRLVNAGDILFSDSENPNNVMLLELNDTGDASTGNISVLVEGAKVGIGSEAGEDSQISALDVIEAKTTAGGVVLESGTILASLDKAETVGSNEELPVEAQDIFALNVSSAIEVAPATSLFFDGSDVGGAPTEDDAAFDAISLLGNPDPVVELVAEPVAVLLDENEVWRFKANDFVSDATVSNLTSVVITILPDPSNGFLFLRGAEVVAGQVIDVAELEFLVYEPIYDQHVSSDSFSFRAASDSEVLAESAINILVRPVADDVVFGSGSGLNSIFDTDFPVNSSTDGDQNEPRVARLEDGGYAVVWHSSNGASEEILLQRFDANHAPVGGEIVFLGDTLPGEKTEPAIAGLSDGGFVVTASHNNGTDFDTWVGRYDTSGNQVDLATGQNPAASQVFKGGSSNQRSQSIAELQDGGFVIAYSDDTVGDSIFATVFHDGFERDFAITNSLAGLTYRDVTVEPLKQGGFVAVWTSSLDAVASARIDAQFFDINGSAIGSRFSLGNLGDNYSNASASVLENNQTVIVFAEETPGNPDGANRIGGVLLNPDGAIATPPGQITIAHNNLIGAAPEVVALSDGGFVVAVADESLDNSLQSIASYRFDSSFVPTGDAQVFGENTTGMQSVPQLDVLDSGEVVAIWRTDSAVDGIDIVGNAYLFEAVGVEGDRITLDLTANPLVGTAETISNFMLTTVDSGVRVFGTETLSGNQVEIFGPTFNMNDFDLSTIEMQLPDGVFEAQYEFGVATVDGGELATHSQSMFARAVLPQKVISGRVFNDEDADGLVHDADGFANVRVLLYEEVAGNRSEIASTTTDADGFYEFNNVDPGTFFIVVDSQSIGKELVSDSNDEDKIWAEQTYGGNGSIKGDLDGSVRSAGSIAGGRYDSRSDDASTLEGAEHVIRRTIGAADTDSVDVDFGFSFNIVSNVADEFDASNRDARTVQGSLRQFIANANHIDGPNEMKFVPAVSPNSSSDTDNDVATGDSWWTINLVDELQSITSSDTILDGQAWRHAVDGLRVLDYNDFAVRNSFSGTVGASDLAFLQTDAPELELIGDSSIAYGFEILADEDNDRVENVEINNFAIHGFGDDLGDAAIVVRGDDSNASVSLTGVKIQNNVIGSSPNDLSLTISRSEMFRGVILSNADDGEFNNNIVVGSTAGGVRINTGSSNWSFSDNEIAGNGELSTITDGIYGTGVSDIVIRRNAIHGNHGSGIDQNEAEPGIVSWVIEENSIFDNGRGTDLQGSGIRLTADGSVVRRNSFYENQFDGVTVTGLLDNNTLTFVPAKNNLITENSFRANGGNEIDLVVDAFSGISFATYDLNNDLAIDVSEAAGVIPVQFFQIANFITADNVITADETFLYYSNIVQSGGGVNFNDGVVNSDIANDGLDVIDVTFAEFFVGNLELEFRITNPTVERVELYATLPSDPDPQSEAWDFVTSIDVSSMTGLGGGIFSVTIPASDFPSTIARDTPIVALAFDGDGNTSEFGSGVTPIVTNSAPTTSGATKTLDEDEVFDFTIDDFDFADPDSDPNTHIVVKSGQGSYSGILLLNGTAVLENQRIPVSSIGDLQFVPEANFFGTTTFQFAVSDGDLDSAPATMTMVVSNVSDAPTGQSQTLSIDEDGVAIFTEATFGFSDIVDGNLDSFVGVWIDDYSGGTLTSSSGVVMPGDFVSVNDVSTLEFSPTPNTNGVGVASIDFFVVDSGDALHNRDLTKRTLTYDVVPMADAPVGQDGTVSIAEDSTLGFDASTFGFSDPVDGGADSFAGVQIVSFSGNGTLSTNAGEVVPNQFISEAELSELAYVPDANVYGISIDTIVFKVVDTGSEDNTDIFDRTLTIDVDPISDAPVGVSATEEIAEDQVVSFTQSSFGFSDAIDNGSDLDTFAGVRIVGFAGIGSLTLDGIDVAPDTFIDSADLARLQYEPGVNATGTEVARIFFKVVDDGGSGPGEFNEDLETRTIAFDVIAVNDPPLGRDFSISLDEESSHVFNPSDFQIDDSADAPTPNSLAAVRIVGWTGPGHLTLDGVTLVNETVVDLADIDRLTLESDSVSSDTPGQIQFTVIDDGGTDNGGVSESDLFVIDFEVRQVNRAPVVSFAQFQNRENSIVSHVIPVSDHEGDEFTLSFAGTDNDNKLFEVTRDGKSIQFIDAPDFENSQAIGGGNDYVVEVIATDNSGGVSEVQSIVVQVRNQSESVGLVDDEITLAADGTTEDSLFANDNGQAPLPDDVTFGVVEQPDSVVVAINPDGTFTVTQVAGVPVVASYQFTYFVENGGEVTTAEANVIQGVNQDSGSNPEEELNDPEEPSSSSGDPEVASDLQGPVNPTTAEDTSPQNNVQPRVYAVNTTGANTVSNQISPTVFEIDFSTANTILDSSYAYSTVDTGLLTSELVSRVVETSRAGIEEFNEEFVLAAIFWNEMESASHEFVATEIGQIETAIAVGALGFTSVAVGLFTRAALLGLSLGATYSQPWWMTSFDFLPIVDSEDEESIEQIVDHQT